MFTFSLLTILEVDDKKKKRKEKGKNSKQNTFPIEILRFPHVVQRRIDDKPSVYKFNLFRWIQSVPIGYLFIMMVKFWCWFMLIFGCLGDEQQMNTTAMVIQCRRVLNYEQIQDLLAHSPCALDQQHRRLKRNGNTDSSGHIYALKATVDDHRTIIDDHRTMINYLMNNTINVTQMQQYMVEQHSRGGPIWKSWRDVSLILLIIICLAMAIYILFLQFRPLERLTSMLVRRHEEKKQKINMATKKNNTIRRPVSDMELDNVSTIDRNFLRY